MAGLRKSTGGEVANALVCKTSIRGFNSRPVLHLYPSLRFVIRHLIFAGRNCETQPT